MKNLKQLRVEQKLSQNDFGKIMHASQNTVSQWENGTRKPSYEVLQEIADYFEVSTDYLLGKSNIKKAPAHNLVQGVEKGIKIPVLGRVAAGIPIEAIEDIEDWEEIPSDWTKGGKEYFGLRVKGDSMYPEYLEDDIVIVLKTYEFNSGDDCVVYVNGYDATLKTVIKNHDDSITIKPINPSYAPTTYTKQEVIETPIVICGVVKELRRKK